ncbi:HEXXH motif domain-containing protein [Amycolatopsis acidicola]|uniref:HEXXH motif domain-containing protein n=1 Tax=Amycolatopsis acidicola TaxID=2596893 RepID=A0A5N0VM98_9PSEU|nr:HEXXH motif-containing putative peptide modification protein [Amycolatopsis acidicola]KAA9166898.1 HEXXH motif domain-containing protein [Amycolatopsis acidicola]
MSLRSDWPDATTVHAALAPASALLAERRTLYQLAVEVLAPGRPRLSAEELDNPLFRFQVGEALAGRASFDPGAEFGLTDVTTELGSGQARLKLVSGAAASERFAAGMKVIHAQGGQPGPPPRLLTEEAGKPFHDSLRIAEAGLAKAREISPALAEDLLPHTDLLAVLDPSTSGGLVSASSRLFPGLILIDRPECPYDVAEALIHEGAHQKFFDLAITHDFLGADIARDRIFHPSWSGAKWPVEQVIAAFHAYACLAQFAEDVARSGETSELGANSLLRTARERETEIGRWLLDAEDALEIDARWLLRTFLREDTESIRPKASADMAPNGRYVLNPLVKMARMAGTGRVLLAQPGNPPSLHWIDGEAVDVVDRLEAHPLSPAELDPGLASVLAGLVDSALVCRVPESAVESTAE